MEITPGLIEMDKAAQIIAERLGAGILRYDVEETGALLQSLDWDAIGNQIHILYNYYGMFPDMGVGKGASLYDKGTTSRKAKPWYNKVIHREIMRLTELMAAQVGKRAVDLTANITEHRSRLGGTLGNTVELYL